MKTLYPDISPFNSDFLVQGSHKIYFEESGNPDGKAVVFLHGGPGVAEIKMSDVFLILRSIELLTLINEGAEGVSRTDCLKKIRLGT